MSQKLQADAAQKHFAVGRGLLAAAETLNFSMTEQRPSRQLGVGVGVGGVEGPDGGGQMPRRAGGVGGGGSSNLGSTMKLFASLGLSPSDLDALAKIPEDEISVETLPHILTQLKSRKGEAGDRRAAMSSDAAYRGGKWEEGHVGRMGGPSLGQSSAQASANFGYGSLQDVSSGRGFGLNYSSGGGGGGVGGSRERPFSELSHHGGLGMGPPEPVFMQRRMGSPSNGKVQDFLGVMPPMFPHVCALCDFDVHSTMEWNQHINGLRHAENRRLLLDMYPDWDPGMGSNRGGGLLETPNLSPGLLGPAPISAGPTGGLSSGWGGAGGPGLGQSGQNKLRSRVVVVKYDRKPLSNKTLFAFAERFGCLREHLILNNKAFLEMNTHEEAVDMVTYYQQHPASLYGKPISFYLSQRLMFIEKDDRSFDRSMERPMDRPAREVKGQDSKVVFFSNLPREDEKKKELLTIAERFGVVEKHLFLTDQAFVQLGTAEDAEMLVKYYTVNPLTIKGRQIRLNVCTKYKTLNVNRRQGGTAGDASSRRSGRTSSSTSSGGPRISSNSRTSSSRSSSSSRTREEKKKEEKEERKKKDEEKKKDEKEEEEKVKPATEGEKKEEKEVEEGGQEVLGVMQGGEDGEEEAASDGEGEKPERAESVREQGEESEGAPQEEDEEKEEEKVPDDIADDAPEKVGGADVADAKQEAESEGQIEATETKTSTEEHESKDEASVEAAEAAEGDLPEQEDFLENMEDFVTLDELEEDEDEARGGSDDIDKTRKGGMRVVNIVGFRRGYNFLNELLGLAKPFGNVVKHLVLDLRPEAFLQFATEEEARAMAKFYNSNVTASVCGRPVRVTHSLTYPTIQCGSSRVVYIGQLPHADYSDEDVLKFAEPFGRVRRYFLNRIRRECFMEMDRAEDAEKMAETYKANLPRFHGKRLTIYVSRKYKQLKHGHRCPSTPKRERDSSPPKSSKQTEEPPTKKSREEEEEEKMDSCDVSGKESQTEERSTAEKLPEASVEKLKSSEDEEQEVQMETLTNQNGEPEAAPAAETKPSVASLPLPPYDPDTPIGVEHVKMGFYCHVCLLFYSNEDVATKTHCSSQEHYNQLQKYLEEQNEAEQEKATV